MLKHDYLGCLILMPSTEFAILFYRSKFLFKGLLDKFPASSNLHAVNNKTKDVTKQPKAGYINISQLTFPRFLWHDLAIWIYEHFSNQVFWRPRGYLWGIIFNFIRIQMKAGRRLCCHETIGDLKDGRRCFIVFFDADVGRRSSVIIYFFRIYLNFSRNLLFLANRRTYVRKLLFMKNTYFFLIIFISIERILFR